MNRRARGTRRSNAIGNGGKVALTPAHQDRFLSTTRVSGPMDPVATTVDVVITKKSSVTITLSNSFHFLTTSELETALPSIAGATYRLQKISFYAPAASSSYVRVLDVASDEASFVDYGTQGSIRPQIHLAPSLQLRQRWFVAKEAAANLYEIRGVGTDIIVIQFTVEIRLPPTSGSFLEI